MESDPKVEVPVKRRPGRPLGSKTKPPEKLGLGKGKLREALADSLTQKDVDKLDAKVKADLLVRMEPKMKEEPTGSVFRLIIRGLSGWECEFCGKKQTAKDTPATPENAPGATIASLTERSRDAHLPPPKGGLPGDFFGEPEAPEKPTHFNVKPGSPDDADKGENQ
jgi:hypothetical protein